jgi:hypothetical protein
MSEEIQLVNHPEEVVEEKSTNNELVEIIRSQTNIDDILFIERKLMECDNDVPKTILSLMNLLPKEIKREPTDIDVLREILNEKDKIYHEVMDKNRK